MKNENLEKYIGELSPEMQEKARACKDMNELNAFLAENDVELSEDALQAVAGGCSASAYGYNQGDPVYDDDKKPALCPSCGRQLYYWDMCQGEKNALYITRMYCNNPSCSSYNNGLWYGWAGASRRGPIQINFRIQKY